MTAVQKMMVDCDFSEVAADDARQMLNAPNLGSMRFWVTERQALEGRRLQGQHGFELTVIPEFIAKGSYTWCAEYLGHRVWSQGA